MYKIKAAQKRLPFGGHHYHQDMGPSRPFIRVEGETADEVAEKLKDIRINNNIPVGDPLQDILTYYSARFPWMVSLDRGAENFAESLDYIQWRRWISKIWGKSGLKPVTKKEASIRWEACKDCPFNQKKDWKTSEESEELTRKSMLIRRGQNAPKYLGYCSLHGWDLSSVTFLETPESLSDKLKEVAQPPACWV